MFDTTIYIGKLAIHEPVTVFTDIIISIFCFIFYYRLKSSIISIKYWRMFFLLLGLSTLVGSCSHAFFLIHEGWKYKSFWLAMQVFNGVGVFYAQMATLNSVLIESKRKNVWYWSYIIQFWLFIILLFNFQKYLVTVVENLIGLLPVLILHFEAKRKEAYYKWIGYGISISFISGAVHATKTSLHAYFNYNDIAHIFIMLSLWVIYLGVKKFKSSNHSN